MRFLIAAALVLSSSLCLAEDFPQNTNEIKSLTAEQAAELVSKAKGLLSLNGLTSINKDVAQELAKSKGRISLTSLTSINKDVAQELANFKGENLFLSAKALKTFKEVNGESPSVMSGGVF